MELKDRDALKYEAERALADAPADPRRLILIHTGVSVALSFLALVLDYWLSRGVGTTGGISGLGMRSALQTAQTVIQLALNVAAPFWAAGYVYVTICLCRRREALPADLLSGFRRFGSVIGVTVLKSLIFTGMLLFASYLGTLIFQFTPFAGPMLAFMDEFYGGGSALLGEADPTVLMDEAMAAQFWQAAAPLMVIVGIVFAVLAIPMFYRLRFAEYLVMDHPEVRAIAALRISKAIMYRNCMNLFRLDLSFWWFYALEAATVLLAFGDVILAAVGIQIPVSAEAALFIAYAVGLGARLALHVWAKNRVSVTYACMYDALMTPPEEADPPAAVE